MRLAISRWSPLSGLALWLAVATPGHGQERIDITKIYEHFVMAKAAMSNCGAPEADLDRSWSEIFLVVMLRTVETLKERNPSVPESQVIAAVQGHTAELRNVVDSVIGGEGCGSAKIAELLRLYRIQARMRLR